jgi:hypothetical protein
MATLTDVSSPANGTAAVFSLLTQLCAAGWIVKRWSDATDLSADNVNLTTNPYGEPGLSGAAASIVAGAPAGQARVQGLTSFTSASVGRFLTISGAASAGNNGRFLIAAVNSATEVDIVNASAVMPDGNNGSISWVVRGLGNTSAWFRVAASGGSREWLFQRGSGDATWTASRSKAGFTGGSPTATTASTATDATALFSAATLFSATPGRWFISADDADGFGWTAYAIPVGGGNVLTFLSDEPLLTGTAAAEDTDPYLWLGYYNATGLAATGAFSVTQASAVLGYKRYTTAASNQRITYGTAHDGVSTLAPAANTSAGQMGQTPVGGLEVPWQIPVSRNAAASTSSGWVGVPRRHRWCTVGGRANGDKLVSGADNWLYAAGLWVKWDSSTPTLS